MNDHLIAEVSTSSSTSTDTDRLRLNDLPFTPYEIVVGILLLAVFIWLAISGRELKANTTDKNAKARSKWAGVKEIANARQTALKYLRKRERKAAALYIIRPQGGIEYPEECIESEYSVDKHGNRIKMPFPPAPSIGKIQGSEIKIGKEKFSFYSDYVGKKVTVNTLWIPDTQRSVAVIGAPGSGKTFSAIDPMLRSIVEQGFPLLLYDFKYPTQTESIAWYAKMLGYKIHVFAPGRPESDCINLMDFLCGDPSLDSALARQLANTLNKNFKLGDSGGGGDSFFEDAGDSLTQAIMMLTKVMPPEFQDLNMTQAILSAPELTSRIEAAQDWLNPWIYKAFDQLISLKESEKTIASIIGTASNNFGKLMMPEILATISGKTTLPLDIDGKTLIVFGMNRNLRDVVAPIVATVIDMIVSRNLYRPEGRHDPLYTVLDELPTVYLPNLVKWINESRSDGFNGIIGFQNKGQLKKAYGEEMSNAIIGGCATKFIFNPGEVESAELFSRFFGDEEIVRENKSKNYGSGSKGGSRSLDISTRKLISPEEFLQFNEGTCIFTNPTYKNERSSYAPQRIQFVMPPDEIQLAGAIVERWPKVLEPLKKRAAKHYKVPDESDLEARRLAFDEKFPIPAEEDEADELAGMY